MPLTTKKMHDLVFVEGEVTKDDLKLIKAKTLTSTEDYNYGNYSEMYEHPKLLVELKIISERSSECIFLYQKEYTKTNATPIGLCQIRAEVVNEDVKANAPEHIEKQIKEHIEWLNKKIQDHNDQVHYRLGQMVQSCDEFDCDKDNTNITKLQEMQKQINQIQEDMKCLKENVRLQRIEEMKEWFKSDECELDQKAIDHILTEEWKMFKDTKIEGVQKKVGFFRR
jgi:hypothetical protein